MPKRRAYTTRRLAVIELATRRVECLGSVAEPDSAWVNGPTGI